jgi:hypothetical protein
MITQPTKELLLNFCGVYPVPIAIGLAEGLLFIVQNII